MGDISIEEYEYYMKNRPHVVILGAGASCAAIPNGDKNGKRIAAMSGFIDKLGLTDIISKVNINTTSDIFSFCNLYSAWYVSKETLFTFIKTEVVSSNSFFFFHVLKETFHKSISYFLLTQQSSSLIYYFGIFLFLCLLFQYTSSLSPANFNPYKRKDANLK